MAKKAKPESVSVPSKLREAHGWFDEKAKKAFDTALANKRKKLRTQGSPLSPERLVTLADELEQNQKDLNPLLIARKKMLEELLPHWAHTGVAEIESDKGRTLIYVSASFCIYDPSKVEEEVSEGSWIAISKRTLNAKLALMVAENDENLRMLLCENAKATVAVTVVSPSSWRPASGETDGDDTGEQ